MVYSAWREMSNKKDEIIVYFTCGYEIIVIGVLNPRDANRRIDTIHLAAGHRTCMGLVVDRDLKKRMNGASEGPSIERQDRPQRTI